MSLLISALGHKRTSPDVSHIRVTAESGDWNVSGAQHDMHRMQTRGGNRYFAYRTPRRRANARIYVHVMHREDCKERSHYTRFRNELGQSYCKNKRPVVSSSIPPTCRFTLGLHGLRRQKCGSFSHFCSYLISCCYLRPIWLTNHGPPQRAVSRLTSVTMI